VVAVDTNVVVRLVTNDVPAQAARAAAVFRAGPVFIPKSVLLETEWVLRHSYGLASDAVLRALRGVLGLPNVTAEDAATMAVALDLLQRGYDFADALHVASGARSRRFVTFDARLVKRARGTAPVKVELA
jgi:predicted nucleic-acid-binding protein